MLGCLMLGCRVTPASVQDRAGAKLLLRSLWLKYPRLHIFADGNYDGPLLAWLKNCYDYELEIVKKPPQGFSILPRRWVVERTFAWLGKWRRLSKDYEQLPRTQEAFIQIAMSALMLKRLAI